MLYNVNSLDLSLINWRYSSEIVVQTRLSTISRDCQQSCEIVEICESRAVGVQISDFWLSIKVDDVIESGNQPNKIVARF